MSETNQHSPAGTHAAQHAPGVAPTNEPGGRAGRSNVRLLTLNGVLLLVLAGVTLSGSRLASAQPDAGAGGGRDGARLRGEYTMVSGRTQGLTTSTLYIIDAVNQEIVALNWDRNANKPEVIGLRSLAEDARFLQRVR